MARPLFEQYKEALRRGHVALLGGELEAALEAYRQAADLVPDRPLPHASMGTVLARLGHREAALAAFDEALAVAPADEATLKARDEALAGPWQPIEAGVTPASEEAQPGAAEPVETAPQKEPAEEVAGAVGATETAVETSETAEAPETSDIPESAGAWPAIDLPSPPPPPPEGPTPDPLTLQAEADAALDAGESEVARDRLLLAVAAHREAGRIDAALDAGLQLLAIAPGDPRVHLAIANLQLDRGWRSVATEKVELLLQLTALDGDAQAEADARFLATERLGEESVNRLDARRQGVAGA